MIQCLLFCFICVAQDNIDSLNNALTESSGKQAIVIHNKLSSIYLRTNPNEALLHANKAYELSKSLDFEIGKARACHLIGNAQISLSQYKNALKHLNTALRLYKSRDNALELAEVYGNRALLFIRKSAYEKARQDLEKSLLIYQQSDDKNGLIEAYNHFGILYEYEGKYGESLAAFFKGRELIKEFPTSQTPQAMQLLINIGIIYDHLGLSDKALASYLKGLAIAKKLNDKIAVAKVYNGIGIIYNEQGKNQEALVHYQKSLDHYHQLGNKMRIGLLLNNIAVAHTDLNQLEQALKFHNQSLSIRNEEGNSGDVAQSLRNIGEVYQLKKEYKQAINYYEMAIESDISEGNRGFSYRKLGEVYTQLMAYDSAEQYLKTALTLETNIKSKTGQMDTHKALSSLYELKSEPGLALTHLKQFTDIKEKVFEEAEQNQFKELQIIYETELKDQQLVNKQQELDILQKQKSIDLFWRNVFIGGFILLSIGIIVVFRYFKSRNANKQQLLQAQTAINNQLSEIDEMKSQFFANISHEFRTPLTLILGPIDTMMAEANKEEDLGRLKVMQRNAHRLQRLINQLLDLSKIDAGNLRLKASHLDIVAMAKGLFFSFQSLSQKNQITQQFDCEDDQLFLFFDFEKLEQILMNLLSNAFKFTQTKGMVKMSIKRHNDQQKPGVEIKIADNGIGIPEDHLPYIFDRFYQVNKSEINEYEGTGIGLSLTRELTLLHKGKISVESKPGKGTLFRLWFPLGKEHLSEKDIAVTPSVTSMEFGDGQEKGLPMEAEVYADSVANLPSIKNQPLLLIVEDHHDLREYIKRGFSQRYRILEATNGTEGVSRALADIPDLIISDIMMPKMNGYQLCKTLKSDLRTSHIPIILLTAKSDEKHKIQGLENEADDYLVKPFNTKELQIRVRNLIQSRLKLQSLFSSSVVIKPKEIDVSSMEEVFLQQLMDYMETHVGDEKLSVDRLSSLMGMSRVHLHRKMQALMNCAPSTFIQRFRLERARDLLAKNTGTIAEIAYEVGFSSPTYFTKCFKEYYGKTPKQHKANEIF